MANPVGSVTAEIILDTKQFEEAIEKLKGDVKEIKESFNQKTSGSNGLLEEVKNLKKEIESLREKTKNYQSTLKTVREENANYAKTIKELKTELSNVKKSHDSFNQGLKEEQKTLDNVVNSAKKYAREVVKFKGIGFKPNAKINSEVNSQTILEGMKSAYNIYDNSVKESARKEAEAWKTRTSAMRNAMESYVSGIRNAVIEQKKLLSPKLNYTPLGQVTQGYGEYINTLSKIRGEFEKVNNVNFTKLSGNIYKNGQLVLNWGKSFTTVQAEIKNATTLVRTELKEVDGEMQKITITVGRVTDVLKTFDYQLLSTADAETKAYERTLELASAMHKMNAQGTSNWSGRQNVGGYSNYVSSVSNIVKKQKEETQRLRIATNELGTAYQSNVKNLNTYKANISQINKALEQQRLRTAQLEAAQQSIYYKNAPNNLNTYKMNMDKINQSLEKQTGIHKRNNSEIKRGQMSMREFGTSMGKAEAYSNNLYRGLQKVRSVIVSFKTIMAAMGGMAVWNFAFELVDKAKETYSAKNEMESLLNKNSHVNAEGVQYFNKALDETVSKFQRINKYGLGETAANIGLEFDLNAKEMADSLDVISMVQNEYIRAGRTVEEAGLAVKDILQGEFMRLSRETGVGKDDLIEKYGWNGKTEDIKDLMKALEKAGKSRHWNLFAEKATSVDDVITITQNRFGEFGADLLTNIEPTIVGAFNGILGAVDSLKTGFSNMGTLGKYLTIGGTGLGAFTGISTALMVFKRNMGLAQIATLGWGRSFGTALLGLNKTDVALHGFWKTLVATTSGTKAATVSNIGFGKSILGRIAGVKHEIQAEHGLASAIMARQVEMTKSLTMEKAAIIESGNLRQKLIYLAKGEVVANKEAATFGKTLKSLITSSKLLKIAILGIGSVAVIGAFATVAQWADSVKQRMELYNETLTDGKEKIKDATDIYDKFQKKLDKTSKDNANYDALSKQTETAEHNVNAAKLSYKLAKQIKKTNKEISEAHDLTFQGLINDSLESNGIDTQKWSTDYLQMKQAAYDIRHAEDERYHFLYQSSQHINEQVAAMKEAKVSEEDRVKYITEYSSKAQEAAENLKKFNQGDINAGAYYLMNRAQLMWIDLWNNQHFIKFWEGVKKTWNDVKPSVYAMKDTLIGIGESLADFFSTDFGRWTGFIALFGTGIGVVVGKMSKWITGNNVVLGGLKKLGSSLVQRIKDWRGMGKAAEEANSKSTGGITPEGKVNKPPTTRGEWWQDTKGKIYQDSTKYARAAVGIAAGMLLISEAVMMLNVPMWSLAQTGKYFKSVEPHVREGIEGLKLIAPVMMVLLPPVIALSYVFERFGVEAGTIAKGAWKAAVGIAAGMLLVAEAVAMMNAPLLAIASVGYTFGWQKDAVLQGKEALQLVTDCLVSLAPTIPLFIGGIALVALAFAAPEIGLPALAATALGIGAAMLLVAEAIVGLNVPLAAIAQTGQNYPDLSGVRQGAEAIKLTATALGYVEDAMASLALITWEDLASNIARVVANFLNIDLTNLTGENGIIDQINKITSEINNSNITQIQQDKVEALSGASTGIKTIGDAMKNIKTAMDNMPPEFSSNAGTPAITYDAKTDTTSLNGSVDSSSYFDQFKEPLRQLKTFIEEFNTSDEFNIQQIDPTRVENINSAANMITSINTAVENVKTAMGSVGDSQWNTAYAEGGIFGAVGNFLFHQTGLGAINNGSGSGEYKSSLGSSLKQMEDIVSDIFTFQTNVSAMTGGGDGGNANVDGAAAMVTQIQEAISKLSQSLSNAVPTFKGKGNAISQAIVDGIKSGLSGINSVGASIVNNLANGIMTNKQTVYNTANSLGKTTATQFRTGADPMSDYMTWEISYVQKALTERKDELGQDAYDLGAFIAQRFKEGDDINSPGLMARAMQGELGYINTYLTTSNLPQMAFDLANALSSNFNLDFNLGNLQFPDLSQWTSNLGTLPSMVNNVKTQVSTNFTNMATNVGTSINNIATNARTKYSQIVQNTRTSMAGMKNTTISHIGNIKTSWRGMQDALIASAENIKSQTSSKISTLKTNLGDFWKKVKNPELLISGSAGGHVTGTIRRRSNPVKGHYAGSISRSQLGLFKPKRSTGSPTDMASEYFKCLMETGKPCYAGGWGFNWSPSISKRFKGWDTHFGKYHLDDYLNVGKFENSNFPVKGKADVAKAYIYDVIKGTTYGSYFDSKFGEDPVAALRAGVFNCWDGTNIILAIARAFGFSGSRGHGTWDGIGHVWASIPGLGIIDPTAIQRGYGFKSPKVSGYAGSIKRRGSSNAPKTGDTHNYNGDVNIHIHTDGHNVEVDNKNIDHRSARQIIDILGINPATGR